MTSRKRKGSRKVGGCNILQYVSKNAGRSGPRKGFLRHKDLMEQTPTLMFCLSSASHAFLSGHFDDPDISLISVAVELLLLFLNHHHHTDHGHYYSYYSCSYYSCCILLLPVIPVEQLVPGGGAGVAEDHTEVSKPC